MPRASDLLQGTPFGRTYPARRDPAQPAVDGRTRCLRVLAEFLGEVTFFRPGDKGGPPVGYRVPGQNIHIEQPDSPVEGVFPSIVFRPGPAQYLPIGMSPYLDESTRDQFGLGTCLEMLDEYNEQLVIEVWAAKKPERRSLMAALEDLLAAPVEEMYGCRFLVPDYFDRPVTFTLQSRDVPDDPDNVKNRRWGYVQLEMRFDRVRLVNVAPINLQTEVNVYPADAVPPGVTFEDE